MEHPQTASNGDFFVTISWDASSPRARFLINGSDRDCETMLQKPGELRWTSILLSKSRRRATRHSTYACGRNIPHLACRHIHMIGCKRCSSGSSRSYHPMSRCPWSLVLYPSPFIPHHPVPTIRHPPSTIHIHPRPLLRASQVRVFCSGIYRFGLGRCYSDRLHVSRIHQAAVRQHQPLPLYPTQV